LAKGTILVGTAKHTAGGTGPAAQTHWREHVSNWLLSPKKGSWKKRTREESDGSNLTGGVLGREKKFPRIEGRKNLGKPLTPHQGDEWGLPITIKKFI